MSFATPSGTLHEQSLDVGTVELLTEDKIIWQGQNLDCLREWEREWEREREREKEREREQYKINLAGLFAIHSGFLAGDLKLKREMEFESLNVAESLT